MLMFKFHLFKFHLMLAFQRVYPCIMYIRIQYSKFID